MNTSRKKEREEYRAMGKGYYHLSTDGLKNGQIFNSVSEFAYGMLLMGLIFLKFSIKIYVFELMPNHLHIILSGTGANCLEAFDYLKRKLSAMLIRDGYPQLPDDYWFNLERIDSQEQMRAEILYVLRNPMEKGLGLVGNYLWGSGWIYYSGIPEALAGTPAGNMSKRRLAKLFGSETDIPDNWIIHPYMGLLPNSFVDVSLVHRLFPSPKDLQTALVKDYEVYFQIAKRLGEIAEFNKGEIEIIVNQTLQKRFGGQELSKLSDQDKGKLAIILHREFGLTSFQISTSIFVREKVIRQLLASKELKHY